MGRDTPQSGEELNIVFWKKADLRIKCEFGLIYKTNVPFPPGCLLAILALGWVALETQKPRSDTLLAISHVKSPYHW